MPGYVAYYRVSTTRQGQSGLGLEAQRRTVQEFVVGRAGHIVSDFTEVESGRRNERAELAAALAACRLHKATLVIAKLDRLARNVAFVSALMEAGVEFIAVDFPQANRLTIHILAAVAEHEAELISARTKAALLAARERGAVLGGFRGRIATDADRARGREARTIAANAAASDMEAILADLRSGGICSSSGLAKALNARCVPAPRGGAWSAGQVLRVQSRLSRDPRQPVRGQ